MYKSKDSVHVDTEHLYILLTASVGHDDLNRLPFLADALKAPEDAKKDLLENVFRYEVFSKQQELYQLVYLLDVPVCPYCNRLFVTTVSEGKKKTRPQLDHYRNKSEYPFLALSIMNLVPSCGVCNQKKSDESREVLYPYADEMGNLCSFYVDSENDLTVLTGTGFNANDLTLRLVKKAQASPLRERIDASIDLLDLEPLYQSHKGYVSNMLMQRYICTDDMVEDIKNVSGALFADEQEVREMLLLGKLDQKHWGDRPLGKLTHDIQQEIEAIYAKTER